MPGFTGTGVSSALLERQRYRGNRGPQIACGPSAHMSRREGLLRVFRSSINAPMPAHRQARAGVDTDDSTVMDRDTVIYHIVDADADRSGPGSTVTSNRGRTHI